MLDNLNKKDTKLIEKETILTALNYLSTKQNQSTIITTTPNPNTHQSDPINNNNSLATVPNIIDSAINSNVNLISSTSNSFNRISITQKSGSNNINATAITIKSTNFRANNGNNGNNNTTGLSLLTNSNANRQKMRSSKQPITTEI